MIWKSTQVKNFTFVKWVRLTIFFSGIALCVTSVILNSVILLSPGLVVILWITGLILFVSPVYLLEFKLQDVTDKYIDLTTTGPLFSNIYRLFFEEMDSVYVKYNSYNAHLHFKMKYGQIKIYIRSYKELYKWLFPLLDKLHEKTQLTIGKNLPILMIKEWGPPGQKINYDNYNKQRKIILIIIIVLVVLFNFYAFIRLYLSGAFR